MRIVAEEIRILRPGQVVDLTVRKPLAQQPRKGRGKDDIADGT